VESWIRIACASGVGVLLGAALRALLPSGPGIFVAGRGRTLFLPLNRLAFWACVLSALVLAAMALVRAMLDDLIPR